jgi:tRNA modification GTPase
LLVDTAGIRATQDVIEQVGIKIAKEKWQQADIKLLMLDAANPNSAKLLEDFACNEQIVVVNKIDLPHSQQNNIQISDEKIYISLKNSTNLEALTQIIIAKAKEVSPQEPSITRARYRTNLALALQRLQSFDIAGDLPLAAEDLRMAGRHLSFITGSIETEEILGEIFANFCIGK